MKVRAPEGIEVAFGGPAGFDKLQAAPVQACVLIGQVYRLRVAGVPLRDGEEIYPTIEVIDRLYPPMGQERKFPIPVDLTIEDLKLALDGKYVTRVIYVEDPRSAVPMAEKKDESHWIDTQFGVDPLRLADTLGRPVAILRIGGRVPNDVSNPGMEFMHGAPPAVRFEMPEDEEVLPQPAQNAPRVPLPQRAQTRPRLMPVDKQPNLTPVRRPATSSRRTAP